MRSLRWLLLVVIAMVAVGTVYYYRLKLAESKKAARPVPPAMALDDKADAIDWEWGQSANGMPSVHLKAKHMHFSADGKMHHLSDIELRIYQPNGKRYGRVHT